MQKIKIRSIEWLITENCNFTCDYCALYNDSKAETDMNKIIPFLDMIKNKQRFYDFKFFIFGGEPFLHPKIKEIIQYMNDSDIDYLFQTNLSNRSIKVIKSVAESVHIKALNVSVHFSQMGVEDYVNNLNELKKLDVVLGDVDVMYGSLDVLSKYNEIVESIPEIEFSLTAVSDFLVDGYGDIISSFNSLRINKDYDHIIFEDEEVEHPISGEVVQRSFIWQEFTDKKWSPKGKVCILKDKFLMYDSRLGEFNCCFHDNIDEPYICPYDECFLS